MGGRAPSGVTEVRRNLFMQEKNPEKKQPGEEMPETGKEGGQGDVGKKGGDWGDKGKVGGEPEKKIPE